MERAEKSLLANNQLSYCSGMISFYTSCTYILIEDVQSLDVIHVPNFG